MQISSSLKSYFTNFIEPIIKPISNLISSVYEKVAPRLPSLSSDTKWYKNRYLLTGGGLTSLFLIVRHFLKTHDSSEPSSLEVTNLKEPIDESKHENKPENMLPTNPATDLDKLLETAFLNVDAFHDFVAKRYTAAALKDASSGLVGPQISPADIGKSSIVRTENSNVVVFKVKIISPKFTREYIDTLTLYVENNEWHMCSYEHDLGNAMPLLKGDQILRTSKQMQALVKGLIVSKRYDYSSDTRAILYQEPT